MSRSERLLDLLNALRRRRRPVSGRVLAAAGLSVPAQIDAGEPQAVTEFLQQHGRVVVKPVRGEQGHDFVPELRPRSNEHVIDKPGYGAFHRTTLEALLNAVGVRQLIVCGVTTEVCVHSTLREAVDRGLDCVTVGDATAASQPELQAPALAMIGVEGGIFGRVRSTDEVVASLQGLQVAQPDRVNTWVQAFTGA